jgi:hypothetical protein
MANDPEYTSIADAIEKGLENVEKYYQKTSDSDIYFICLGEYQCFRLKSISNVTTVLDPNYKLAYVEGRWSDTKVVSGRARLQAVVSNIDVKYSASLELKTVLSLISIMKLLHM